MKRHWLYVCKCITFLTMQNFAKISNWLFPYVECMLTCTTGTNVFTVTGKTAFFPSSSVKDDIFFIIQTASICQNKISFHWTLIQTHGITWQQLLTCSLNLVVFVLVRVHHLCHKRALLLHRTLVLCDPMYWSKTNWKTKNKWIDHIRI